MIIGPNHTTYSMPATRTWKDLKALLATVFILVVIITATYFSPPLIPLPAPEPFNRNKEIIKAFEHSAQTHPLTSEELHRFRESRLEEIILPTDIEQATAFLNEIESLWEELQEISQEQGFRREQFAPHTRLGDWKRRIDTLYQTAPSSEIIGSDIHALPDKLIAVGIDYATNPFLFKEESSIEEWFVNYYLPMAKQSIGREPLDFVSED